MGFFVSLINASTALCQYQKSHIKYIDYFFEFGSPLNWFVSEDSTVTIDLLYDFESSSPNRAAGHWYFKVVTEPGTRLKLAISNMDNIWNGKKAAAIGNVKEEVACYISYDQKKWRGIKTSRLPDKALLADFVAEEAQVFVARIPPYTTSHLSEFLNSIRQHPDVKIIPVGATIEKRPLEIIQVGNPNARKCVVMRGRAHPWESGGSWFIEGMVRKALEANLAKKHPELCLYIMPMANKDGVVRGMTRFNVAGRDLNRNWNDAPDPEVDPERFALERFIEKLAKTGKNPVMFFDMHNDDWGRMGIRPMTTDNTVDIARISLMKSLLEKYTHFSEAVIVPEAGSPGRSSRSITAGTGVFGRYGVEKVTFELNANWVKSLQKIPLPEDWIELGANFNFVLYDYLITNGERR